MALLSGRVDGDNRPAPASTGVEIHVGTSTKECHYCFWGRMGAVLQVIGVCPYLCTISQHNSCMCGSEVNRYFVEKAIALQPPLLRALALSAENVCVMFGS